MEITNLSSNEDVLVELGNRLKALRIEFPLTQAQLADRAGVSQRTIVNLECGKDVTLGSLVSVLRALAQLNRMNDIFPSEALRLAQFAQLVKPPKKKLRVSSRAQSAARTHAIKWGDE